MILLQQFGGTFKKINGGAHMTARRDFAPKEGVNLCYFDGSDWHSPGFFNPTLNILALDINLSVEDQKQVALHELESQRGAYSFSICELNRELLPIASG
ncbi:MAG: hypothetical protein ACLVJN_06335 [Streptococcus parasanguinis]